MEKFIEVKHVSKSRSVCNGASGLQITDCSRGSDHKRKWGRIWR